MVNTIIFEKTPLRCALMQLCAMRTTKSEWFFRKSAYQATMNAFRSSVDEFNHGEFHRYPQQDYPNTIFISATDGNHNLFMEHLKTMHSRIKKQTGEI